ncbi:MAG: hypothetical protein H7Z21_01900 [Hymenobacter sp.]|nr:hypothetical protein [Hymenobacter sp.]
MPKAKLLIIVLLLQVLGLGRAWGQQVPPLAAELQARQPVNIFPADAATSYSFSEGDKAGRPSEFGGQVVQGVPVFTAEVFTQKASHYGVQAAWKSRLPVRAGDVLLARLAVRATYARQESGEGALYFYVQQTSPPHDKSVIIELSAGPEWKTIEIPFAAAHDMAAGEATICLSFGALPQRVEVADVQVLNFGPRATLAQLPTTRFSYAGRAAGAAWRR